MAVIDHDDNHTDGEAVVTYDALAMIYSGKMKSAPVLRVIDVKVLTSGDNNMRHRLVLYDGKQTGSLVIAAQLNGLIDSGELKNGSLVRLCDYVTHSIQNHMVIFGTDLKVIVENRDQVQPTTRLTSNAIEMICNDQFQGGEPKPVLQVTDVKSLVIETENTTQRYRGILSDGVHCHQVMFAMPLNDLINSGKLQVGSIVRLTHYFSHVIKNRKIIFVIELEMVDEKCDIVGEPKLFVPYELPATMINEMENLVVA